MEPVSAPRRETVLDQEVGRDQRGKGHVGSLNNPESYVNVPGHVIPILEHEFEDFSTEAGKFLGGETEETEFIKFRLKQGVYGQRQPGVQMVRVKLPFGAVTPDQMDAFADAAERFTPLQKGHITTRQNIQLHHVPLDQMTAMIAGMSETGLSSREGCGNTIRNVTGDPFAGIASDEIFDPTEYAGAYVRYFVRHPTTQLMPRKIKTSFTGSEADRAISGMHDIAFVSQVRDGVRGFQVLVGGGTSIMPRVAQVLYEFVEAENGDYLRVSEAVFRIFDRQNWLRVNRARARIKVLVDKVGIDEFREMVDLELEGDWVEERDFDVDRLRFIHDEAGHVPAPVGSAGTPNGDLSEFDRFRESSVRPQRQEGFSTVEVKVTRGDLTPEQFRGLGQIMRDFTGGHARTTVQQNIVLRWARDEAIYEIWRKLGEIGLGDAGASEITDVVSCPGTDSCKLGITASMGLNEAVQAKVESMNITDPLTREIHIKMSGCPNGCSQHHLAAIGFYGASLKVGGRTIPAYIPHLAGNYENGRVVFGKRLKSRLPAKRVPEAVERWLRFYEAERLEGEPFNDFVDRLDTAPFEEQIKDLTMPVEFSLETMGQFIDWNRADPYKVERGEGECAV